MSNNRVVRYLEMDSTHRVNLNDLGYNISQGGEKLKFFFKFLSNWVV